MLTLEELSLDRMVEGLPDEGLKPRWRSGGPRLQKLIEIAKRKAGGPQLDGERTAMCNAVDGDPQNHAASEKDRRLPRSKHRRRSARVECEHDAALAGVV
jgi:hypothetical protein